MRPARSFPGLLTLLRRCALGPRLAFGAVLAYFIAPCLHTAHHRNDHQHVGDGIRWVDEEGHPDHHASDSLALYAPTLAHGAGGLAHFGAAVLAPPPFQPPALFVAVPTLLPAAPVVIPRVTRLLSARPRGPPAATTV